MLYETFISKWAIHFAEAVFVLLVVLLVVRIFRKYKVTSQTTQRFVQDHLKAPKPRHFDRKSVPKQDEKAPKDIVDNYIDGFF